MNEMIFLVVHDNIHQQWEATCKIKTRTGDDSSKNKNSYNLEKIKFGLGAGILWIGKNSYNFARI